MAQLRKPVKLALVVIVIGGAFFALKSFFPKGFKKAAVISVNDLPPLPEDKNANAPFHQLPDSTAMSDLPQVEIRAEIMGWNAQAGVLAANGGAHTMKGSIMEEQGVKLHLICQNDCNKQGQDLYSFIADYASGNKNSSKGAQMIAWMGDGCPSYFPGLNDEIMKKFGPDYIIQVFCATGSSYGEDKAIFADNNPAAHVKQDPATALRGSLWVGVLRDGDWNILMKYADMNQIPVNNDAKTYDPNAINWVGADDYVKAAQAYVAKTRDTRKLVRNGKLTKIDTTVEINGVVTWFPGDKIAFDGRGGVTVASTKDFSAQMPCVFIACKKWLQDNRTLAENFIYASALGGDQVKSHSTWLSYASKVADEVYQDNTMKAKDWEAAFKGFPSTDANGVMNNVGGSRVFNLADDAAYFGLSSGTDKYSAVYNTFADVDMKAYPELFSKPNPPIEAFNDVVDESYMLEVYTKNRNNAGMAQASTPQFKEGQQMTQKVSSGNYTIEFDVNSATITESSYPTLEAIGRNFIVAENLLASIVGHTDNTGDHDANISLSQKRAESVKNWLMQKYPDAFRNKITTLGVGPDQPLAGVDANSKEGRQMNRRVEIILGRQ